MMTQTTYHIAPTSPTATLPHLDFDEVNASEILRQIAGLSRILGFALRGLDADPSMPTEQDVHVLAELAQSLVIMSDRATELHAAGRGATR